MPEAAVASVRDRLGQGEPVVHERLGAVERMRLTAVAFAIALMVFSQAAGYAAADTKLDLVVDPARFLHRAMTLWDPIGNSGQLQDQAYGYLFPMGPFYLLGKLASLPPWVIQRSWESAILIVAFLGACRLAKLIGVPGFWPCVASGLAYALAPRMLSELFSISAELLPVAVLPLVLIPLVTASTAGPVRSAAMRSGLALLFAGGINASATLAILPVPALWLLTRSRGPRRASLIRWWALAVVLSCLWWLIPLVTLGRYSPPFLNWIESAAVTTSQNSFIAVARGADHWQAYLGPNIWPAGWIYAVAPAAILATALVAAIGFCGLLRADIAHRQFLVFCLLLGFGCLTLGHAAAAGTPFALPERHLLDGPLVAFRNIHKFDPLVRLPLAIGVGYFVGGIDRVVEALARQHLPTALRDQCRVWVALCLAAIGIVALAPALSNVLVQQPRATPIADYWEQAANWLGSHAAEGRTLVLPGAGRPEMVWGSTVDEPMQAVARSPWATREIVPLGQPGYVRLLDAIESMIATGTPQPALPELLRRSGFDYVLVRADLRPDADATDIGIVMSTLRNTQGLSLVQSFGPDLRDGGADNRVIDQGVSNRIPAIQILRVLGAGGPVSIMDADHAVFANGSADQLPNLITDGLGTQTPVLFGADSHALPAAAAVSVLTDGIRKREVQFGHPGYVGATMTANQPFQSSRVAHDYLPVNAGALSAMQYSGIADVRASSSGSDSAAYVNRAPDHAPWYALDGNPDTSWESGSAAGGVGQWFEVRLVSPISDPVVTIELDKTVSDQPTSLMVRTDSGSATVDVIPDSKPQRLTIPKGPTQTIRLTFEAMQSGTRGKAVGLASISIGGVAPQRTLVIPGSWDAGLIDLHAAPGRRTGCAAAPSTSCLPALARTGEEDGGIARTFTQSRTENYQIAGTVTLRPGLNLDQLLDAGSDIQVSASSTASTDPRQRPGAVVDGLSETTWSADPADSHPTLVLRLARPTTITGLVTSTSPDAPVSTPSLLRVSVGSTSWTLQPNSHGVVTLPSPIRATSVTVEILRSEIKVSTSSATGSSVILPTGISELQLSGVPRRTRAAEIALACGRGPVLTVDGRRIPISAKAELMTVLDGGEMSIRPCGPAVLTLASGPHDLTFASSALATAVSLTLTRGQGLETAPALLSAQVHTWGTSRRTVRVAAQSRAVLVVHENFNAGWHATMAGRSLAPIEVDGWQQAFILPAGSTGEVVLSFGPEHTFKTGLLLGLLAILLLGALAFLGGDDARRPGLQDGRLGSWLTASLALVMFWLLAGWIGLLMTAAALAAGVWLLPPRRARGSLAGLAMVAVGLAGLLNAIGPSVSSHALTDSLAAQGLLVLALLSLVLAVVAETDLPERVE